MTRRGKQKRPPPAVRVATPAPPREPPLDEAEAILADIDGPHMLAEVRRIANRNCWQRHRSTTDLSIQPSEEDVTSMDAPHIGIFWFVRDDDRHVHLLSIACPMAAADAYGDRLTSPAERYQTWEGWRRGRPKLPLAELASLIVRDEYETWPRGRIVYDRPAGTFVIYADRQLLHPPHLDQIRTRFHLPPEQTVALTDLHYRSVHSVGRP